MVHVPVTDVNIIEVLLGEHITPKQSLLIVDVHILYVLLVFILVVLENVMVVKVVLPM